MGSNHSVIAADNNIYIYIQMTIFLLEYSVFFFLGFLEIQKLTHNHCFVSQIKSLFEEFCHIGHMLPVTFSSSGGVIASMSVIHLCNYYPRINADISFVLAS